MWRKTLKAGPNQQNQLIQKYNAKNLPLQKNVIKVTQAYKTIKKFNFDPTKPLI